MPTVLKVGEILICDLSGSLDSVWTLLYENNLKGMPEETISRKRARNSS